MLSCLIIDDDANNRDIAKHVLIRLGYKAETAKSARDGLHLCSAAMPSLVLLDWYMPGQDGLDFLCEFRALPFESRAKVIMCTAERRLEKVIEAVGKGADGYLVKPYSIQALVGQLQKVGLPVPKQYGGLVVRHSLPS